MAVPQRPPAHSLGQIALEKGWATIEQINEARRFQARKKDGGEKVNAATNLLITGNILFPMNHTGVTGLTYSIGLDYAF